MSDPLSIAGLILAAGQVISSLIDYGKTVKDAAEDIARLSQELFALKGVLEHLDLQQQMQAHDAVASAALRGFDSSEFYQMLKMTEDFLQSLLSDLDVPKRRMRRLMQKLEWPFKRTDMERHFTRLDRAKAGFTLILISDNFTVARHVYGELTQLRDAMRQDQALRQRKEAEIELQAIRDWLCPFDYWDLHQKARSSRQYDSGRWFLDLSLKEFMSDEQSGKLFWNIKGKSGAGKTTVFSQIVEDTISHCDRHQNALVAFHYCNIGNANSQQPESMLRALISHMSLAKPAVLERFRATYRSHPRGNAGKALSMTELQHAVIWLAEDCDKMYLVVDAVNESAEMANILGHLGTLFSRCDNLNVLVTSIIDIKLTTYFDASPEVTTIDMKARQDIEAAIAIRLHSDVAFSRFGQSLRQRIQTAVSSSAEGSFRYAQLTLDNLSKQRTGRSISEALQRLPHSVQDIYANILRSVATEDAAHVRELLLWTSFAPTPLTIREMSEAVIIQSCADSLEDDDRLLASEDLVACIPGLIHQEDLHIVLSHSSVQAFITSEWLASSDLRFYHWGLETVEDEMVRRYLKYLLFTNFSGGLCEDIMERHERLTKYPFLRHASNELSQIALARPLKGLELSLLQALHATHQLPKGGNLGAWIQVLVPDINPYSISPTVPLYYAASFGLVHVIQSLLNANPDQNIDALGGRFGSTPLFVACWREHWDAAAVLVQAGANPNIIDNIGLSALQYARQQEAPQSLIDLMASREEQPHYLPWQEYAKVRAWKGHDSTMLNWDQESLSEDGDEFESGENEDMQDASAPAHQSELVLR